MGIKIPYLGIFGKESKKLLSFLKSVNYGIGFVFSRCLESVFSQGLNSGPSSLYKECQFMCKNCFVSSQVSGICSQPKHSEHIKGNQFQHTWLKMTTLCRAFATWSLKILLTSQHCSTKNTGLAQTISSPYPRYLCNLQTRFFILNYYTINCTLVKGKKYPEEDVPLLETMFSCDFLLNKKIKV